jgi:hypothetical protein
LPVSNLARRRFRPLRREFKIIECFAFKVKTESEHFINCQCRNHLFNIPKGITNEDIAILAGGFID